jgi:aspartate/methionine/tyrosine aminotransferase
VYEIAEAIGATVIGDEAYRWLAVPDGDPFAPPMFDLGESGVSVGTLSKPFGLPGLRIGWIVSQPAFSQEAWARHDYTTIGPSGASDHLASVALDPLVREKIIDRTRRILHANYPVMEAWLKAFGDLFTWHAPHAGAICWARFRGAIPATEIVEKLRAQHSVLLCPGEHFGMPGFLRFGYGGELQHFQEALAETERGLRRLFSD